MAKIEYYSPSQKVSMADAWFDVATLEHFWVQKRFEVFQRLLGAVSTSLQPVAEIGCGHGLVQAQFKRFYGLEVDGFELNEYALSKSVASDQPRFIYDIHNRKEELREKYGLIILFDVIEHIEQEAAFLRAVLFHLNKGGLLAVNVPALQFLYSNYDRAAGHVRRYSIKQLEALGDELGLQLVASTYWGMPLLPLLVVRKALLAFRSGEQETIDQGFRPPSVLANKLLKALSAAEPLPQGLLGTSVMCVFRNPE